MGEEGTEKTKTKTKTRMVESLGWLTESSIMPKKHRAICGVGPSSILELKAQLYKSQEEAKLSNKEPHSSDHHLELHRAKKKITAHDHLSRKNSGVDARALKDKLELKAVTDGSASYAALEKKAELYDKLASGEMSDEEDKEKYCVDFFSKSLIQDESQQPQGHDTFRAIRSEYEADDDDMRETKATGLGRAADTIDNNEHKRFVREVHEEVNEARERVSELKMRRQEQVLARREKLRQAYLRKQLEKLKAASKTEPT